MTNAGPSILHAGSCTAGSPAAGIRQGARLRIVPPEITASERQRGADLSRLPRVATTSIQAVPRLSGGTISRRMVMSPS
jgi:hypothetical protein